MQIFLQSFILKVMIKNKCFMFKSVILALCLFNPTLAIELTTLNSKIEKNNVASIELAHSLSEIRYFLSEQTKHQLLKYQNHSRLPNELFQISYLSIIVFDYLFTRGGYILIHEIGHAGAAKHVGYFDIQLNTPNKNNLSALELYYFSSIHGTASTTYRYWVSEDTPVKRALVAGAGINTQQYASQYQYINAAQNKKLPQNIAHDILFSKLGIISYSSSKLTTAGNDFKSYMNALETQGVTISHDTIKSQILWTTLFSGSFLNSAFSFTKNNSTDILTKKIANTKLFLPDLNTFLMPSGLSLLTDFFIHQDHIGLISFGHETITKGLKTNDEYTIGWYPTWKQLKFRTRMTFKQSANLYVNHQIDWWVSSRWAITAKLFIGDRNTNAQKREYLTDDFGTSLGIKFKLNK